MPGMLVHGEAPEDGSEPLGNDVKRIFSSFSHFPISNGLDAFANNKTFGVVKIENISKNVTSPLRKNMIFFMYDISMGKK